MQRPGRIKIWNLTIAAIVFCWAFPFDSVHAFDLRPEYNKKRKTRVHATDSSTVLARQKSVRYVNVTYQLDLKKQNRFARRIVNVMELHDESIRECYIDRLDKGQKIRGRMALGIRISRVTGRLRQIKRIGGGVGDRVLFRCVRNALAKMPLAARQNLQGTLIYYFDSHTEIVGEPSSRRK